MLVSNFDARLFYLPSPVLNFHAVSHILELCLTPRSGEFMAYGVMKTCTCVGEMEDVLIRKVLREDYLGCQISSWRLIHSVRVVVNIGTVLRSDFVQL